MTELLEALWRAGSSHLIYKSNYNCEALLGQEVKVSFMFVNAESFRPWSWTRQPLSYSAAVIMSCSSLPLEGYMFGEY